MKSVLISIKPKWCELIASGKKTIEVRKSRPKLTTPFKCYIYCTQGVFDITLCPDLNAKSVKVADKGRGKVVGEFVCDRIYEAIPDYEPYLKKFFNYDFWDENGLLIDDCLSDKQKDNYAHGTPLYGWHISDLKIYDKPKELGEFCVRCSDRKMKCNKCNNLKQDDYYEPPYCESGGYREIARPPQSWCYVEEL